MNHAVFPPSVMIVSAQVHRIEACNESHAPGKEPRSGFGSGLAAGLWSGVGPCDPHEVQRLFPDQWKGYLRAHFRGIAQVVALFHVSERTARKWWNGEVDPGGHYVAIACRVHPETAPKMLFAAE